MLILASTNDKIQLTTSSTATTDVQASFVDLLAGVTSFGRANTAISSATTTDIVASPASSTQRNVKHLSVRNRHASTSQTVTLLHTDGTTAVELFRAVLAAGEQLVYDGEGGFRVYNVRGAVRVASSAHTVGTGNPTSTIGYDGDWYTNSQVGDIWHKEAGTWVLYGANAYWLQGLHMNDATPGDGQVLTWDQTLFSSLGGWTPKAGGGGSTPITDVWLKG